MYLLNTNHVFSHEHGTMGDIKEEHITQSPQYKGACNLAERRGDGGNIYEAIGGKSKYDVKQRVNPKPPNVWDKQGHAGESEKGEIGIHGIFKERLDGENGAELNKKVWKH